MLRGALAGLMCFVSVSAFSGCPMALPTDNVNFCASFKTAAICYCTSAGFPAPMCQDMNALYLRMIAVYGSLNQACAAQKYTSTQDCLDNWGCYRQGGIDSQGRLCSSNQNACHK